MLSIAIGATIAVVNYDLGKPFQQMKPGDLGHILKSTIILGFLSIVGADLSKTSFAVTLLRFVDGRLKILIYGVIISMNIGLGTYSIYHFLRCSPVQYAWDFTIPGHCLPSTQF